MQKYIKKQVDFNQEQKNKVFLSTFLFSFRLLKEKQNSNLIQVKLCRRDMRSSRSAFSWKLYAPIAEKASNEDFFPLHLTSCLSLIHV